MTRACADGTCSWCNHDLAPTTAYDGEIRDRAVLIFSFLTQSANNHLTISRQRHRIRTGLAPLQDSIRPEAAFAGESLLWRTAMWMRSCIICKALLKKLRLSDFVRCQCGWEWQGHGERS